MTLRRALLCEAVKGTVRTLSVCGRLHDAYETEPCIACVFLVNSAQADFAGSVASSFPDMTVAELAAELRAIGRSNLN